MCPVLSQWEIGQEGAEAHDGPSEPGPAIERDWRQSLPKTLEKAERPPDPEASFCNPLTKRRGYSKLVNEYYNKQNEILSQFNDLDTFEERMAVNAEAMQRERERTDRGERLAIKLSNIANVLLFCLKVYASIATTGHYRVCQHHGDAGPSGPRRSSS
ncbi:hypothetical protein KFL_003430015 [Klebsormidium nitens]|uniref:Uncharacterized protein n=1 Tax=Klebsormidium nitens TaxID=105231 RepID=A0A0U9I7S4_KLENI|nr:hypothetical protein KFL_003430015 [Klebsormidium nitens]|eukprot:GAQ87282.1 hypothetical protein KFL_003430015 [Klebsormidium nitens]